MNKPLILVVEDDIPVRNLITITLKTHGYRYLTAGTGDGAVVEASSHNPDVVLLDLGLPDMDGVDVIRKIRTWSNLPIIVISARSEDTDKIDALDAGADDLLTKPFSVEELLAAAACCGTENGAHERAKPRQQSLFIQMADCGSILQRAVPIWGIRSCILRLQSINCCASWLKIQVKC